MCCGDGLDTRWATPIRGGASVVAVRSEMPAHPAGMRLLAKRDALIREVMRRMLDGVRMGAVELASRLALLPPEAFAVGESIGGRGLRLRGVDTWGPAGDRLRAVPIGGPW